VTAQPGLVPADLDLLSPLAGFTRALRAAGVPVTQDRAQTFVRAVVEVGPEHRDGVYWAGRSTLCSEPDQFEVYDKVFTAWFRGEAPNLHRMQTNVAKPVTGLLELPGGTGTADQQDEDPDVIRAKASDADVIRHRDVADLTPAERQVLAQMFALLRSPSPQRRSTRRRPRHRGQLDARRTLREELRRGGEPGQLRYRRRAQRPRRVVLLIDVSGSMSPYADALLRLAHVWVRGAPRTTEVFTVGTRLTRVTRALRGRDPEVALKSAGEQVPDWSGGTRLGDVLGAFLDRWGQRGVARRASVVIFSDGWERGDPAVLAEQMARLRRLAHQVVWVNPHRGKAGYRPVQGGIAAALPYCDDLVAGHSLATFVDLMEVVSRA
jgi:uncharacterized protein